MLDVVSECTPFPEFPWRLPSSPGLPVSQAGVSLTCARGAWARPLAQSVGRDLILASAPAAWKAALWDVFGRQDMLPRRFVWREKKVVGRYGSFSNWNEWKWDWTEVSVLKINLNRVRPCTVCTLKTGQFSHVLISTFSPLPFLFPSHLLWKKKK